MSSKTRIGIIGFGGIANAHVDAYKQIENCEVIAACDIDKDRLKEKGDKYGITSLYADYNDLLADKDVEAVSVCVGNALHCETAVAAAKAGKHVLLEKPMAMNADEGKQITDAAKQAGVVGQMAMCWRHQAETALIKKYVDNGTFGNIYHIRAVTVRRRGIPGLGGWFTTKSASGGGPLIDIGVHWFDRAMYLAGLWQPTAVSAMNYAKFGPRMKDYRYVRMWAGPPRLDGTYDVEDYSTGLVRFGTKATMEFEMAWACNGPDEMYLDLLGDKGGVRLVEGQPVTILTEDDQRPVDLTLQYDNSTNRFVGQAKTFVAACRGEGPNVAPFEQGLTVMRMMDTIYASAEAGKELPIPQ